jgi:hypothetical protein
MARKNRNAKTLLRTFSRYSNISDTIPMERYEQFTVKNGRGIGIERWYVTNVDRDKETKKRFFIAEITELHPFYN